MKKLEQLKSINYSTFQCPRCRYLKLQQKGNIMGECGFYMLPVVMGKINFSRCDFYEPAVVNEG